MQNRIPEHGVKCIAQVNEIALGAKYKKLLAFQLTFESAKAYLFALDAKFDSTHLHRVQKKNILKIETFDQVRKNG